jgi:hypothetical protein
MGSNVLIPGDSTLSLFVETKVTAATTKSYPARKQQATSQIKVVKQQAEIHHSQLPLPRNHEGSVERR